MNVTYFFITPSFFNDYRVVSERRKERTENKDFKDGPYGPLKTLDGSLQLSQNNYLPE